MTPQPERRKTVDTIAFGEHGMSNRRREPRQIPHDEQETLTCITGPLHGFVMGSQSHNGSFQGIAYLSKTVPLVVKPHEPWSRAAIRAFLHRKQAYKGARGIASIAFGHGVRPLGK